MDFGFAHGDARRENSAKGLGSDQMLGRPQKTRRFNRVCLVMKHQVFGTCGVFGESETGLAENTRNADAAATLARRVVLVIRLGSRAAIVMPGT